MDRPDTQQASWVRKLRVLLRGRDVTQRQLAQAIGSSDSLIAKWMSGTTGMSVRSARKVAEFLGVTVDELLSDGPLAPETIASLFDTRPSRPPAQWVEPKKEMEGESGQAGEDERRRTLHALVDVIPGGSLDAAVSQLLGDLRRWHNPADDHRELAWPRVERRA